MQWYRTYGDLHMVSFLSCFSVGYVCRLEGPRGLCSREALGWREGKTSVHIRKTAFSAQGCLWVIYGIYEL